MLICDLCGTKRSLQPGPASLFNVLQLRWSSVLKPEMVTVNEFHLCNECTKELSAELMMKTERKEAKPKFE